MIPEFPKFKKLELADKKDVEKFTSKYPPYSDFNFTNMWSWDTRKKMSVSQLNKNLVVLFDDYVSNEPFLSFIGKNKVLETVVKLLQFSKKRFKTNVLKLIPEEIVYALKELKKIGLKVKSDRDSYDYVYSVSHLANMHNWPGHGSSKRIRQFTKKHPNHVVEQCPVGKIKKEEYLALFKKWAESKKIEDHFNLNEYKALERFLQIENKKIEVVSVRIDSVLVGFTLYELLPNNGAISHFLKADNCYHSGINDILSWEEAKHLFRKGVTYYNWEQDLGIPGLRFSKEKYSPSLLMKKFTIGFA